MANVLVTGGAGFIGSHLTTALVERGHRVCVMDNLTTGHRENLSHLGDRLDMVEADLREFDACRRVCRDREFVFHQAAIPSVPKSVDNPPASHETNADGTFNLLRAAVAEKVRRVIYAASSSAYGDAEVSPKHENLRPEPLSPYAVQKLLGEHYNRAFYECFELETISLRYFNVFGARQDPASQYAAAIPAFVTALLKGESPVVYGDGQQTRDFTYIDNVVHGNLLAMEVAHTQGETVNIACGEAISVNEVIAEINRALGTNIAPRYEPRRPGDVKHSRAAIERAKELLGYEPVLTFGAGLRRAIDYYRSIVP